MVTLANVAMGIDFKDISFPGVDNQSSNRKVVPSLNAKDFAWITALANEPFERQSKRKILQRTLVVACQSVVHIESNGRNLGQVEVSVAEDLSGAIEAFRGV
jgi:hypothetical protein